jgi:hypothetical protein
MMRGLAGGIGALMVASGVWVAFVIPVPVMTQFSMPLQLFFSISVVFWIAMGVLAFLWSIGGPDE